MVTPASLRVCPHVCDRCSPLHAGQPDLDTLGYPLAVKTEDGVAIAVATYKILSGSSFSLRRFDGFPSAEVVNTFFLPSFDLCVCFDLKILCLSFSKRALIAWSTSTAKLRPVSSISRSSRYSVSAYVVPNVIHHLMNFNHHRETRLRSQTLSGPFSAVSTPIFAIRYSFESS